LHTWVVVRVCRVAGCAHVWTEVVGADGGGGVRACGSHPCRFRVDLVRFGVGRQDTMLFIYLKIVVATNLLTSAISLLLYDHSSDGIVSPFVRC
jgi:hypothetical protein